MDTVRIRLLAPPEPLVQQTVAIFRRILRERAGVAVSLDQSGPPAQEWVVTPGIGREGFRIEDAGPGLVRVTGNDPRGLLYGVGKLLRDARYGDGCFAAGAWRGQSVPVNPVRGMYFATHFHNHYHDAPLADVERYIEELALWGCNALNVWYDMHHYHGIGDPAARAMIVRLRAILAAANRVGIGASLCGLANEAYAGSPEELRATPVNWTGYYYVELCPHKPGALELLLRWRREMLAAFAGIDLEYFWIWPYDQGGCLCDRCAPWGGNGFLAAAEPLARLVREHFPKAKTVLSTWCFGYRDEREWPAFARALACRPDWIDYLMIDSHGDFPEFVRAHGVPGGYPVLNFPEISMAGMTPWGGFGANPLPGRFDRLWQQCRNVVRGGFPYSEGVYEDLNKVLCLQFYWDPGRKATDMVHEYAAYEFLPAAASQVVTAVTALEANHGHDVAGGCQRPDLPYRFRLSQVEPGRAADALSRLREVDARLPAFARTGWRWRLLLLRAELDARLAANGGTADAFTAVRFAEIAALYHAANAEPYVRPPVSA